MVFRFLCPSKLGGRGATLRRGSVSFPFSVFRFNPTLCLDYRLSCSRFNLLPLGDVGTRLLADLSRLHRLESAPARQSKCISSALAYSQISAFRFIIPPPLRDPPCLRGRKLVITLNPLCPSKLGRRGATLRRGAVSSPFPVFLCPPETGATRSEATEGVC